MPSWVYSPASSHRCNSTKPFSESRRHRNCFSLSTTTPKASGRSFCSIHMVCWSTLLKNALKVGWLCTHPTTTLLEDSMCCNIAFGKGAFGASCTEVASLTWTGMNKPSTMTMFFAFFLFEIVPVNHPMYSFSGEFFHALSMKAEMRGPES